MPVRLEEVLVLGDPGAGELDVTLPPFQLEAFAPGIAKRKPSWITGPDVDGALMDEEPRYENAEASIRVRVWEDDPTQMDAALAALGDLIKKLQETTRRPGGLPVRWTPAQSSETYTMFVLLAEIDDLPITMTGDDAGWLQARPVVNIRLTRRPFLYGNEVDDPLIEITGGAAVFTLETSPLPGDVAAEARLVVTDLAGQPRRHVEWGRETYPTGATPASVEIDSDSFITTGFPAVGQNFSGAYDPNATGNNVVAAGVTTQETAVCGIAAQPHTGAWRVKARVWAEARPLRLRLAWQAGDGPFTRNAYVAAPVSGQFCEVDLGIITNQQRPLGTQRWSGQIEAFSLELVNDDGTTASTQTLRIDALWLLPVALGYGKARSSYVIAPGALVGRDEFTGTTDEAALNGRIAPQGGTWATSGAANDFVTDDNSFFAASGETLKRTSNSDSGPRFALLGTTAYAAVDIAANAYWQSGVSTMRLGLVARYVDASNYLRAAIRPSAFTGDEYLTIDKIKAGTLTTIALSPRQTAATSYTLRLTVYPSGNYIAQAITETGAVWATLAGFDADLATGGTLDDGKAGLLHYAPAATASTVYFDDFAISTPPAESVVMYANRRLEVRSDGCLREDAGGTYWGQPPAYRGDRFWLAPAGDEDLINRVAVKVRRNDIETDADGPLDIDATSIHMIYTPRYLAPR